MHGCIQLLYGRINHASHHLVLTELPHSLVQYLAQDVRDIAKDLVILVNELCYYLNNKDDPIK